MCGIAAIFACELSSSIRKELLDSLSLVEHRGPDGDGSVFGKNDGRLTRAEPVEWGLGHKRLAIIDLSDDGQQPMAFNNKKLWIALNGEIYNYIELRTELEADGIQFTTASDTEVVLAAYARWGKSSVERFIGMFAFVIVDLAKREVFVCRDRLGIKPLYFLHNRSQTIVVSELKQLHAFHCFHPRANLQQVTDFLTDGVIGHKPGRCFFEEVRSLPAGHFLQWKLGQNSTLETRRYWQPSIESNSLSWSEAVEKTRTLFFESIKMRLRADVVVGSCLSGGVDSSSVVGVVTRHFDHQMKTFSSCFSQANCNEKPYIEAVVNHCNTEPVYVFPSEDGVIEELDELIYHQDEPFSTLSIYAQWCVMKAAREAGVTVLLDGQGGDETLCGYRKFSFFYLKELLSKWHFGKAIGHSAAMLFSGDERLFNFRGGFARRYLPGWLRGNSEGVRSWFTPPVQKLVRQPWSERMVNVRSVHEHQFADLQWWSLPALLRYEDRNSMAHSIEARVPFVDHRFIEHCLTLPTEFFFCGGRKKNVLLEAMGDLVPQEVHNRKTKMGFDTPQDEWLRGRTGEILSERIRSSERLNEIVDKRNLPPLDELRNSSESLSSLRFFRLASLAMWLERFSVDVAH